jgi:hypothetical protein
VWIRRILRSQFVGAEMICEMNAGMGFGDYRPIEGSHFKAILSVDVQVLYEMLRISHCGRSLRVVIGALNKLVTCRSV